jgi:hypothetical protein
VIEQVREEYPEISIERLCELMGVSRSWYYERSTAGKKAHRRDADLRDGHRADRPGVPRLRLPSSHSSVEA